MREILQQRLQAKIAYINQCTADREEMVRRIQELDVEIARAVGAATELDSLIKDLISADVQVNPEA